MQRAAGTSRMVPDPQTAKEESGTKGVSAGKVNCTFPFRIPLNLGERKIIVNCQLSIVNYLQA